MTSRLKRKLNDLGVDPSSSKTNESFCLIGTPLPPLEKSKDTGEFVPLWKQEVRDEKGRRRLHGAFTGGFSAGYFNTVGSKEGWTPSTFVSSRSERAKKKQARPEDFMDDEDLAELRESRQLVDENEEMDFGGTESELRRRAGTSAEDDSMVNTLAATLAPPVSDSVGARILRKMGWRLGQGIGPRITYEQRRIQDRAAGATLDEEDEEAKKHMHPRRDTPLLLLSRKDNSHGVGYRPDIGLNESLGRGAESKGPHISAGFGLGALNDADEDDLDVYDAALGSERSKRILAYDAADEEDQIMIGSSRKRGPDNRVPPKSLTTQTFRDGRPVLKGFVLSDKPVAEDRWFPLPDVPKGWKPNPRHVWDSSANKENEATAKGKQREEPPRTHEEWKRSLLSANERGSILGETPLPSQQRSVFDYMSQKDKERLEDIRNNRASGTTTEPPEAGPSVPPSFQRAEIDIPHLHPSIAKAALQGFQPFTTDPVKQSRYTAFLNYASSGSGAQLAIGALPDQRIEDFNKELADYAKAATVFKPLSGAMASRFKSAVIVETGPKIIEGLHTPDVSATETEETKVEEKKEEDPRMAAVRLGMYGPLTREVIPWQPARLLCKRFGVKDPEVELSASAADPEPMSRNAGPPGAESATPPLAITEGDSAIRVPDGALAESRGPRNLANIGLGDDDEQGRDTLTYQRPAMDVFKAIFASDDEDSDAGDEDADVDQTAEASAAKSLPPRDSTPGPLQSTRPTDEFSVHEPSEVVSNQKVDLATFKPTFVPRSGRESRKDKEKETDRVRDKKKKKTTTLVSFDAEDEGLQINVSTKKRKDKDRDGERKKKKRKEKKDDEDDDSMWVEKPTPDVVHSLALDDSTASGPPDASPDATVGPPRGRKRAIDFM